MSKFQIISLVVFGAFILVAVMVFSFSRGAGSGSASVVVWGDIPSYDWGNMMNLSGLNQDRTVSIQYVEKNSDTLASDFTEALAEGRAPDLIVLPLEDMWSQKARIIPIPYENVSQRDFQETFIEGAELFLGSEGIYALPISVDPLVLYYNRDLLTKAGIANPIEYWDQIYTATSQLTQRDLAGNILKSAIALGEANNIGNYKSILSLLMLQAGTPITAFSTLGDLEGQLTQNFNLPAVPAESALDFYTQFSNSTRAYYSWNRSLLPAQTHFTSGDSAYYVGFASELRILRAKNPTLNIGVSTIPQSRVSTSDITFGRLKGLAVSRGTSNPGAALSAVFLLVGAGPSKVLADSMLLPPVRRDLLSERQTDAVLSVFYESALQSRGWIDPDARATQSTFREMIESVTSGRARVTEAVRQGNNEINALIK
ncbi:MAG: extracellular solute-binding protein [Parcubacteria group bacterium]